MKSELCHQLNFLQIETIYASNPVKYTQELVQADDEDVQQMAHEKSKSFLTRLEDTYDANAVLSDIVYKFKQGDPLNAMKLIFQWKELLEESVLGSALGVNRYEQLIKVARLYIEYNEAKPWDLATILRLRQELIAFENQYGTFEYIDDLLNKFPPERLNDKLNRRPLLRAIARKNGINSKNISDAHQTAKEYTTYYLDLKNMSLGRLIMKWHVLPFFGDIGNGMTQGVKNLFDAFWGEKSPKQQSSQTEQSSKATPAVQVQDNPTQTQTTGNRARKKAAKVLAQLKGLLPLSAPRKGHNNSPSNKVQPARPKRPPSNPQKN